MGAKRHCVTASCPVPHNWPITRERAVPRWVSERRLSERREAQNRSSWMEIIKLNLIHLPIIGAIYKRAVSPWLVVVVIWLGHWETHCYCQRSAC